MAIFKQKEPTLQKFLIVKVVFLHIKSDAIPNAKATMTKQWQEKLK